MARPQMARTSKHQDDLASVIDFHARRAGRGVASKLESFAAYASRAEDVSTSAGKIMTTMIRERVSHVKIWLNRRVTEGFSMK